MLGSYALGTTALGSSGISTTFTTPTTFSFNGFNLADLSKCVINFEDSETYPRRQLETYQNYGRHGGGINIDRFTNKTIRLTGIIHGTDVSNFQSNLSAFKKAFAKKEGTLNIYNGQIYKKTLATVDSLNMSKEHYNITFIKFECNLIILSPFFTKQNKETVVVTNQSADLVQAISYQGEFPTHLEVGISLNSATSVTEIILETEEEILTITNTFNAGDDITINKTGVYLNGTLVDFSGLLPILQLDDNSIQLNINGTFNFDIVFSYEYTIL